MYRMSHQLVNPGWLTLISVIHHLAKLPSRFWQIPITQAESGRQWNTRNPSQQNPVYEHMGRPVYL